MKNHSKSIFYSDEKSRPIVDREFLLYKISKAQQICALLQESDKRKITIQRSLNFLQGTTANKSLEKRRNRRYDTIVTQYREFLKQGIEIKLSAYLKICQNRIIYYNKDFIQAFQERGIDKHELIQMGYKSPSLFTYSVDKIEGFFLGMKQYGLEDGQIADMLRKEPSILGNSSKKNQDIFQLLMNGRSSYTQVGYIVYERPDVLASGVNRIKATIEKLQEWGFTNEQCASIVYRYPSIFTYNKVSMQSRYDKLQTYIQDSQLIEMIYRKPNIMGTSMLKIEAIIQELEKYISNPNHIGTIIYKYPSILTYGVDRTQKKGDIFKDYGLEDSQIGTLYTNFPNILGYENQRIQSHLQDIYKTYNIDVLSHHGLFWFNPAKLQKIFEKCKSEEILGCINQYDELGKSKMYQYQGIGDDPDIVFNEDQD